MSLDAIRKSIVAEADVKAKALDSEASEEASQITKEAQDKAKAIAKQAEEEAKHETERLWKESQAGLETERSTMVLEARGRVIEHILRTVRSEAERSLAKDNMEKILKAGLKQFAAFSGSSEAIVKTSKKNAALLKGKSYKVEYGDVDGFIISTPDRKIALNATVSSIVDREIDTIRKLVANEVFSGREGKAISKPSKKSAPKKMKMAKKPAKAAKRAKAKPKRKR